MNQVQTELLRILQLEKKYQSNIIKRLDDLYRQHGCMNIEKWRNMSNGRNSLLHELVERDMDEVIRHLVLAQKFDVNTKRDSDGRTALQLAINNSNFELIETLKELGGIVVETVDVSALSLEEEKDKSLNIVWLDLEMTSIKDPEIMECAVIITDKDLNTLERANWVIHFEQSVLDGLEDWHQNTFKNVEDGGNGLFADVLRSTLTKDQVEEELLALIKRHCPKEKCPLAGSSIHTDKDVLKRCMPRVNDYLSYRIIDVSSFQAIIRRWTPWIEPRIKRQLATSGQETVNHRAMDDIKWSIAFMREFRPFLPKSSSSMIKSANSSPSYPNQAAGNLFNRKGSNIPNHGGSNGNKRNSLLNPHSPGSLNQQAGGASYHQYKSNNSDSQGEGEEEEENGDNLPKINPKIDQTNLYSDERRLVERINIEKRIKIKDLHLTPTLQRVYNLNPHLREVFLNKQRMETYEREFNKENRYLADTQRIGAIPAMQKRYSTVEHWGQRKLLLTEIEFLTKYGSDDNYLVVYAGAAPGSHLNYLSTIFPGLDFDLFDEKEFCAKQTKNITIKSNKFTRSIAQKYVAINRKILFICNVRTFRYQADGQDDINDDMENQLDWYRIIKPQAALLNFRLSRTPDKTSYLKGHLMIEPWASSKAAECRLMVKKDAKMIDYDYQTFEANLYHFQNITRVMYYNHDVDSVKNAGLDHCYDCRTEIFILEKYLTEVQRVKSDGQMKISIANMSQGISREINDKNRPPFLDVPRTLDIIPKRFSAS